MQPASHVEFENPALEHRILTEVCIEGVGSPWYTPYNLPLNFHLDNLGVCKKKFVSGSAEQKRLRTTAKDNNAWAQNAFDGEGQ